MLLAPYRLDCHQGYVGRPLGQPADLRVWLLEQLTVWLLDLLAFVTAANLNAVKAKHDQSRGRLEQAEHIANSP